ncbi:hypothetical protein D6D54_07395 [Spiroplasma poulsonii]|uniref:Uncharacterized protein n=1 Tax=Spiroplasma poulsonii TaxID=2138 RepID=A0A3S0URP1_9MOLU|nr:hypothetical protein [Spiroplasma poulsonii]MBW3058811.1 hypothetical protein [Spiroplasma poulsonii]RUP75978.1 hypothetical protein D6D54_07395 [Spiroplasma poulsonii]
MEIGDTIYTVLTTIWFAYMVLSIRKSKIPMTRLQPSSFNNQQKINISTWTELDEKIISITAKNTTITIGELRETIDEVILKMFHKNNINITSNDYSYQIFKNKKGEAFKNHNLNVNSFVVFIKIFSKENKLIIGMTDYIPVNLTIANYSHYLNPSKN